MFGKVICQINFSRRYEQKTNVKIKPPSMQFKKRVHPLQIIQKILEMKKLDLIDFNKISSI